MNAASILAPDDGRAPAAYSPADLASLFASLPWAVLLLDAHGLITLANPAAALWGKPLAQLQRHPLAVALPRAEYPALHELLAAPAPAQGECYLPHSGQWLAVSTTQLPQGLALYAHDITEWQRTKAAAPEQAHPLASITDATPDLLYIFDLQTSSFSYVDGSVQALLGYSPEQVYAQGAQATARALHPADYAARQAQLRAGPDLAEAQVLTQEVRLRLATGDYRWFRLRDRAFRRGADGRVCQLIGRAQAVQAEHEAAAQQRQQHDLLLGIFTGTQVGLSYQQAERDDQGQLLDFRLQTLNPARAVGQPPTLMQGPLLSEVLPELRAHELWGHFETALASGRAARVETYYQQDGVSAWLDVSLTPHGDGLIVSSLDISARKQAEATRQASYALLQGVLNAPNVNVLLCEAVRDPAGRIDDFRLVLHSQSARALYATTAGPDLRGHSLLAALAGGPSLLPIYRAVVETGQPTTLEITYDWAGAPKWLRLDLARHGDGLAYVWNDVTASKLAEPENRRDQELLQGVFNSTTDGIEVFKSIRNEQGELVDFEWVLNNQVSQNLLRRTDLVGKRLLEELPGMWSLGVFGRHRRVADFGEVAELEWHYQGEELHGWFHSVAVQLGDGLLLTWQDITERKHLQAETLRLQLSQQQQLAQAVLEAEENEKRRIAESLHNGLGQLLYATKLSLNQLDPAQPTTFAAAKHKASELLGAAIGQTRTLSHELMPQILEDFGLEAAIQDICTTCSTPPLRMRYRVDDLPPRLSPHLALALYRMAQELANNIVKHAQATRASLQLIGQADGTIELRADDNGVGFEDGQAAGQRKGIGLQGLHDRVRLLRGTLRLQTAPGQGTQLIIRLPWVVP